MPNSDLNNLSEKDKLHYYLAKKEGWDIDFDSQAPRGVNPFSIILPNGDRYGLVHPFTIHLGIYRDATEVNEKFYHMKAAHDYLWPHYAATWHDWDEQKFYAHCQGYKITGLAGGGGTTKSHGTARVVNLFFIASPRKRSVIVSSTTLASLEGRIWGYVVKLFEEMALPLMQDYSIVGGQNPRIQHKSVKNKIHGMFAIPVKDSGKDDASSAKTLSNAVGRHPDDTMIVVLDEAPFLTAKIVDAIPNWEKGIRPGSLQIWALGNSDDKNDLHGALCTPKNGWDSIQWGRDTIWETTRANSICIYFNPYESPAITEKDPIKKAKLGQFLITEAGIEQNKRDYGEGSINFWRMCLGWWPPGESSPTLVTEQFLTEQQVMTDAEWSGFYPLYIVAGLDSALTVGGTGAKLSFGIVGHTMEGRLCIDFKGMDLLFDIEILPTAEHGSKEKQLSEKVISKLIAFNCPLSCLAMDCTGLGQALGELLSIKYKEKMGVVQQPFRIHASRQGAGKEMENDPNILVYSPTELWTKFKSYVTANQVRGLDKVSRDQMKNRLLLKSGDKYVLESKQAFKARMASINPGLARSPDEADARILTLLAAFLRYGFSPNQIREAPKERSYDDWINEKMRAVVAERQGHVMTSQGQLVPQEVGRVGLKANFVKPLEANLPARKRLGS